MFEWIGTFFMEFLYYLSWRFAAFMITLVALNAAAFMLMSGSALPPKKLFFLFNSLGNAMSLNILLLTKPYFAHSFQKKFYGALCITVLTLLCVYTVIYQFLS